MDPVLLIMFGMLPTLTGVALWQLNTHKADTERKLRWIQQFRGAGYMAIAVGSGLTVLGLWNGIANLVSGSPTSGVWLMMAPLCAAAAVGGYFLVRRAEQSINWRNHLCPKCEYPIGDTSTCSECGYDHSSWL